MKYYDPEFEPVILWIRNKRENAKKQASWDELMLACKKDEDALVDFIETRVDEDDWPAMTIEEWQQVVLEQKNAEEATIRFGEESGAAIIHGTDQINTVRVSQDPQSSWQTYKKGLTENGFKEETVNEIERATLSILRKLSLDTTSTGPIKGLVIGNVQSGKTANMAALMAMAADCGWNMFIILSGTIENLRVQTENRLYDDLHRDGTRIIWETLNKPSSRSPLIEKASRKSFSDSFHRYFTVCLKNKTRLKELLLWLQEDSKAQKQMKILVIDDEADQAGINTADVDSNERKAINALITNLVNGKTHDGEECRSQYQCMNYIGYTATPYANVLNESGLESLYPKDFIATLSVSDEYFGPQQIFGCEDSGYEGLDIVRNINQADLDAFAKLHKGYMVSLPESLIDSISWFLCGAACLRYWQHNKPISMLVHTSQNTGHHANVATAIEEWVLNTPNDEIISNCEKIWKQETTTFSFSDFLDQYPDYGIKPENIKDYPDFSIIKSEIENILTKDYRISNIPLSNTTKKPRYHTGIHLCIDNCKNNGTSNDAMVRLMYPEKGKMPTPAPIFIVVGGATLSRGLTIEGLISTYFLRSVKQSDTLMQMGRWFGYRKGYELLPRLWITPNTQKQFEWLALLDQRLRDEIHHMATFGISPAKYGPRIMNSPRVSFLRIVAKNRMQKAIDTDRDFSGASSQTQMFDNDYDVLKSNIDVTRNFLIGLGKPEIQKDCNRVHAAGCRIWRNVTFDNVKEYLKEYSFQERQRVFQDIDSMIDWIQKMTDEGSIGNWNVVLAGKNKATDSSSLWEVEEGVAIHKVSRAQVIKGKEDGILSIGALRVPKDIIADIDLDDVIDPAIKNKVLNFKSKYAFELREQAGLSSTPQLLIYVVDKDSQPTGTSGKRCPLDAKEDVVGISLTIPGESKYSNNTATVSVLIEEIGVNNEETDVSDED